MKIKTGIGIDVHRLEAGREFWLGGIKIGHEKGCVAHSDGDVLIHAICDALLGATGLGDIGQHFPDTCPAYKGIVSSCCKKRKP
jgi:2-C-methyl-D-erythritol 2,4-cyclodiphosphate synthase